MNVLAFSNFKNNYIEHSIEYGNKHYQKLENYYGPGKHRYFWTKEEWDAYQKEKNALLEKARADVAKRDNYNKNAEAAKQAGADRAVKEKINKYMKNGDYDNVINTFIETPEVKEYIEYLKNGLKDCYDYSSRNEKYSELVNNYTKKIGYVKYGIEPWLSGYIESVVHNEAFKESNANIEMQIYQDKRRKMEQDAMYQTALQNKDSVAVLNVVNKKVDDYWSSKYVTVADTSLLLRAVNSYT